MELLNRDFMKKVLLFLAITLSGKTSFFGQDNKPHNLFVYEGKTWFLQSDFMENENVFTTYFFQGDTIINGDKCLKMYYKDTTEETQKLFGYWTEKNHKVYYSQSRSSPPELFYDFSLEINEQTTIRGCNVRVLSVDTIYLRGNSYRCLYIEYSSKNDKTLYKDIWIEGIGSVYTFQPFYKIMTGIGYSLLSCKQDGKTIVTREDYYQIVTDISSYNRVIINHQNVYDLRGHPVTTPQKNRLYIKNGKKYLMK